MTIRATISRRGAQRWRQGHPWIYRSDVVDGPRVPGIVVVADARGAVQGQALWSPGSEIRLRRLTRTDEPIDTAWWTTRLAEAAARRAEIVPSTTAYRVVHAEGDGLPSLVIDRYDDYVVCQLLSAGLEASRVDVLRAIDDVLRPAGVLLRNDASVRRHEGLPIIVETVRGHVPETIEVREGAVRYLAALHHGQKTGAFLDQRANRILAGQIARGRALDVCCYQGGFALHMREADEVLGIDVSRDALAIAAENARLNGSTNVHWREGNAFDLLRELDEGGERFDTIVLDPPAFAKDRDAVLGALRGYKELNRRALRMLNPGGRLLTASCSYHVGRAAFLAMLSDAAADVRRPVALERILGQPADHPELLTVPETGYLKGALLRVDG